MVDVGGRALAAFGGKALPRRGGSRSPHAVGIAADGVAAITSSNGCGRSEVTSTTEFARYHGCLVISCSRRWQRICQCGGIDCCGLFGSRCFSGVVVFVGICLVATAAVLLLLGSRCCVFIVGGSSDPSSIAAGDVDRACAQGTGVAHVGSVRCRRRGSHEAGDAGLEADQHSGVRHAGPGATAPEPRRGRVLLGHGRGAVVVVVFEGAAARRRQGAGAEVQQPESRARRRRRADAPVGGPPRGSDRSSALRCTSQRGLARGPRRWLPLRARSSRWPRPLGPAGCRSSRRRPLRQRFGRFIAGAPRCVFPCRCRFRCKCRCVKILKSGIWPGRAADLGGLGS
mmetsp:Transcript_100961/g.324105  ORF Transcript_100961/g.324105 Transcript_100961/m.324105 type:complete len:342 (+) Transcript_100961:2725-3750(+)